MGAGGSRRIAVLAGLALAWCGPVVAQTLRPQMRPQTLEVPAVATESVAVLPAVAAPAGPVLGPETNLPLPRFVSLKTQEGNVRRGPSLSHRIDWVFLREDLPLQIVAEYGHWRQVVDSDGVGGWMNYAMLSGNRTVLVQFDLQPIYAQPDAGSTQNALLELGVVAQLGACQPDWCRVSAGGYRGWVPKAALWGVDAGEVRD